MRALDPEAFGAVWAAVESLLPDPPRTHPLKLLASSAVDRWMSYSTT